MLENTATPAVQGDTGISFDANGEMQFTEAGLKGFEELLKEDVTDNTVVPTEESLEEANETEEEEVKEAPKKEIPKRKLKVDGQELEVSEDEMVPLAQQGVKFTQKMQQLSQERDAMAPYQALLTQLKTDPNLSKHIADYWKPREQAKPQFDDPIEQLKYEIKQEARADAQQLIQQTAAPMQRMQALNQIKQQFMADPDYAVVHQQIVEMVKSQPPSIQKNLYLQLDQDPQSYGELYHSLKSSLASKPKPTGTTTETEISKTVKRTEKAPILESSNSAPAEDTVKAQRAKIDKVKAKVLRSGSVEALQNFLEVGGFLDHMK